MHVVPLVAQLRPPGVAVAVYEVSDGSPTSDGTSHVTGIRESRKLVATTFVGEPGVRYGFTDETDVAGLVPAPFVAVTENM